MEYLSEAVFSVRSVPRLYDEGQLPLRRSLETEVRRVEGSCEMAASLRGREPGNRGSSTVQRCYQAAQWRPWLVILVCVWWWFVKCSHELYKSPINQITNPNPVYSHSATWQYVRKLTTLNMRIKLQNNHCYKYWLIPKRLLTTF
jgi:hypothetical protein